MNILVNGGTKGIGREAAEVFAGNRNNVVLVTGRNRELLDEMKAQNPDILTLQVDLLRFSGYSEKLMETISEKMGSLDIILNVAGLMLPRTFMEVTESEARMMMETNFFGPAAVIRLLQPLMPDGSHILNISSMGGFQGSSKYRGLSYYSASKAALACLTECLAEEFREYGIRVNCLALGSVQTEMLEEAFPGYKAPVTAKQMGEFIADFALSGHKVFNGKILPVAVTNP